MKKPLSDGVISDSIQSDNRESSVTTGQCPVPLRDYPHIVMGHGGGGKLSAELIEHVFLAAFGQHQNMSLPDATVIPVGEGRIAFSTDSYVVQPLFFPGGSIGDLAINGTVNDLAMRGARPKYLSAAFILEEGFPIADLSRIAQAMSEAARCAGVRIIAGDTKVVQHGHADGCYLNTTGIGIVPEDVRIAPDRAQCGDAVILSGTLGDHGMAIMAAREGLEFESPIESDTAPLHELVGTMIDACPNIHVMRDPTRGGLAASLNEIAQASNCGIVIDETLLPINPQVQSACEILGLDPMLVANEGKLVCVVPAEGVSDILAAMRANSNGRSAVVIGHIVEDHPGIVIARTSIGASRIVMLPLGEQLPRIC